MHVTDSLRRARGTLVDGLALAVLLATIFCAEAYNRAGGTVVELREQNADADAAAPDWLADAWAVTAFVGLVAAIYVAWRFVEIARTLDAGAPPRERAALSSRALPWIAAAAVVTWVGWQALGIADVADHTLVSGASKFAHYVAIFFGVVALVAGGSVPGNAVGVRRASFVRVQLFFFAALFALVFVVRMSSAQLVDVLRAWGDLGPSRPAAGVAGALLLGAVCRASATRLLVPETTPISGPAPDALGKLVQPVSPVLSRKRVVAGVLALAVVFLALPGFDALAVLALGVAALAAATRPVETERLGGTDEKDRVSLRRLAGSIGVIPIGILLAGLVTASVDSLLLPSGPSATDVLLLLWTAGVVAGFGVLATRAHRAETTEANHVDPGLPGEAFGLAGLLLGLGFAVVPGVAAWALLVFAAALAGKAFGERGARELWGGWGVVVGLAVAVYIDVIDVTRAVGAFGLAFIGATGLMALLHLAASAGRRRELRWRWRGRAWAAPVVSLLVVWFAGAALTLPDTIHQAPTVKPRAGAEPLSLDDAVGRWLDRQTPNDGGYVPMLFVGASGGGSKAAYWTDLVVDCILGEGTPIKDDGDECRGSPARTTRFGRVFLTSSASGGSIGIHHLLNHHNDAGGATTWITGSAGREVLSPVVGWGMFHDLPAALLGIPADPRRCDHRLGCPVNADRSLVQEAAIAGLGEDPKLDADAGLLGRPGPVTVFNGVVTKTLWRPTQRRVLLSGVDLSPRAGCAVAGADPDAVDGHDLVPGRDVALVTAAMLSARFPALEPAARLGDADCDGPRSIGDGGLYENTGLLTIAELLPRVRRAVRAWQEEPGNRDDLNVRPIVLSIDDDVFRLEDDAEYDSGRGTARGRRSTQVRRRLQRCAIWPRAAYRRISPSPHVGAQAATGWEISETARQEDLGETLRALAGTERDIVQEVRDMLDGSKPPDCDPRTRG